MSAAFTIKKIFADNGGEALAFHHSKPTDTLDTVHDEIYRQVSFCREDGNKDPSTESMDMLQKLPLFLKKWIGRGARFLDRRGWMPKSVVATDPYQSSCVIANLGSIKLHSGYHHLTNWGTTSVMCLTIDERVADGYYYSGTIRLLRHLLENPELLETPLAEPVNF